MTFFAVWCLCGRSYFSFLVCCSSDLLFTSFHLSVSVCFMLSELFGISTGVGRVRLILSDWVYYLYFNSQRVMFYCDFIRLCSICFLYCVSSCFERFVVCGGVWVFLLISCFLFVVFALMYMLSTGCLSCEVYV